MGTELDILGHGRDHSFDEPLGLLADCHRRIEKFLGVIARVVDRYADKPLDAGAADAIVTARRYFAESAPLHTADEDESLFPRMRAAAGESAGVAAALARLGDDHAVAADLHNKVDGLLGEWAERRTLSPDRAADLAALVAELAGHYRGHIAAEESEVFPLAATLLGADELAAMGREMRARRGLGPAQ